jgi:hypothetical protein
MVGGLKRAVGGICLLDVGGVAQDQLDQQGKLFWSEAASRPDPNFTSLHESYPQGKSKNLGNLTRG